MTPRGHVPERRCVACGRRGPQESFIRFHLAYHGGRAEVVVDSPGERRTGRGAYLCPRRLCLDKALKKRAFPRAFRASVRVDPQELTAKVERRLHGETVKDGR
jgi:hypothetical protein